MTHLLARILCWWYGHECYSLKYADGRVIAPPCQRCGGPNIHISDSERQAVTPT